MKTLKGLDLDNRPSDVQEGYYVYAKNGLQTNIDNATTNEDGFIKLDIKLKYNIIGTIEISNLVIIFSTNNTGKLKNNIYSEIGVLDTITNTYKTIIDDSTVDYSFNFSCDYPIKGEAQKNYNNETIVVWKNNLNPAYFINIDNNKAQRLDDYLLFPSWKNCSIESNILSGGNLERGAYTPVIRYIKDGVYTDYFNHGKTVYTSNDNNSQINITITNPDKNYSKIQVAILSVVNGITKVVTLAPVSISDTVVVSYFGVFESEISFESLYSITPYYNKVKAITQLNDELFLANIEEQNLDKINYYMQVASLNAKFKWKSTLLSEVAGTKGQYTVFDDKNYTGGKWKSFAHQEVYAFYIVGVLKNGRKTKGYITSNRASVQNDLDVSSLASTAGASAKVFQVEDTVINVDNTLRTGDFGYWENDNEKYPTDIIKGYGNPFMKVAGQKVRHYKTPSHNFCFNNFYSDANLNYGTKDLDLLSIFVDSFVIPSEIKDEIVGIEVFYAKRNQTDITNLGQSLLLVGAKQGSQTGNPINISSTGGNFNFKGYSTEGDSSKEMILEEKVLRFHSFDMLNNNFSVKPDLIVNQLRLKKTLSFGFSSVIASIPSDSYGDFEGLLNDEGDFGSVFYKERSVYQVIDYTTGRVKVEVTNPITVNRIRKLSDCKYTLNNSYFGDIDNRLLETCYTAKLSSVSNNQFIKIDDNDQTIGGDQNALKMPRYEITYLSNLIRIVNNVFTNFNNQTLISADIHFTGNKSLLSYSGDMFISDYSFVTYGRRNYYDRIYSAQGGNRFIHRFLCETAGNVNLRYQKTGDLYSNFYPKSDGKFIRLLDKNLNPNEFGYDKELNTLYEQNITCFNSSDEPKYVHPFRIIKSSPNQKEKTERSWRNFLPLDYHEADKSYDEIINLQGLNDKLLIHHKNALFVTRDKVKLNSDSLSVTLGSGDIFEFTPIKAVESKLGFGGINGDLGTLISPLGYHFYKDGRPFVYNEGLKSISNRMFNFFMKYLTEKKNNPYKNNGVIFGYDNVNKRFLMTVKSEKSYTLSYSIENDNWVFFHDYVPDYYIHSLNNLYSVHNNEIYINSGGKKGVYYTNEIKPFYIDVVFSYEKEMTLDSIGWITENITNYLDKEVDNEFNTITHISIRTNQQHSGRIKLVQNSWIDKNYSKKEGYFSFNEFKNVIKRVSTDIVTDLFSDVTLNTNVSLIDNWYDKDNFESKYFIIRFEYDNNTDSLLVLKEASINFKLNNI